MIDIAQVDRNKLDELDADQLRELTRTLLTRHDREITWRDAKIDKLTFELAQLKRLKFDRSSEQMSAEQRALFDEAVDGDIAAIDEQLAALQATLPPKPEGEKKNPKRVALPDRLPRRDVSHEPDNTTCGCGEAMKRVGEDVSEKLDYTPGVFTVERHVRGKWCCAACRTLVQAPVPAAVIDKGIPAAGCSRRCWWPSMRTTCRCTGRKRSSAGRGWRSRARRWGPGSASAGRGWSLWPRR